MLVGEARRRSSAGPHSPFARKLRMARAAGPASHPLAESDPVRRGNLIALEIRIVNVHVEEDLLLAGYENRIDPDAWRPLIISFSQFYGLGGRVHTSRLAEIPESAYRPRPRPAEPVAAEAA
jgi:hypothetical protein